MVKKNDPTEDNKRLEEYAKSHPDQLLLFELLGEQHKPYSNTIELFDFMPKFVWGKVEREKAVKSKREILPNLERVFECRGVRYKLRIEPASIKGKDGIDRDYYPGKREEIVEAVLRKLAAEGQGVFLDDAASVVFSLYQVKQELEKMGHCYSKTEIKEALLVCAKTKLEVTTEDGKTVMISSLFETVGLQTQEDWKGSGEKSKCFVRFNTLVTQGIKNKVFRLLNYGKNLSLDKVIARQLHKRMSHHFTQASTTTCYEILLSTIIRDFGLTQYQKLSNNLRDVELAMEELKGKEVIRDYKKDPVLDADRRNKFIDVKISITPHQRFINDVVKSNDRHKKMLLLSPRKS